MPYNNPMYAPFRRLPAGQPQLGFAPLVFVASAAAKISAVQAFGKQIAGLFGGGAGKDAERIARAKVALAAAINGTGELFDGVGAREWINQQRMTSGSQIGRNAYQAAFDALVEWDKQQAVAAGGVPVNSVTGKPAPGTILQAGMSSVSMFVLAGIAVGGYLVMKNRR
jgi:hypothetical protein